MCFTTANFFLTRIGWPVSITWERRERTKEREKVRVRERERNLHAETFEKTREEGGEEESGRERQIDRQRAEKSALQKVTKR